MRLRATMITLGAVFLAAGSAQALPVGSATALGGDAAPVVQVRGGCGFGAHRGPFGGCRLNRGPRGAIRRSLTGAPGGCPPGRYRGPYGGCRFR